MNVTKRNGCKEGYIRRKSYNRKYKTQLREKGFYRRVKGVTRKVYPKMGIIHVDSACIKDPKLKNKFGPLRPGLLIKHGYQYRLPIEKRHEALRSAVKEYGPLSTYHKLDAVAKLGVKRSPKSSKVFATDRDWIRKTFPL